VGDIQQAWEGMESEHDEFDDNDTRVDDELRMAQPIVKAAMLASEPSCSVDWGGSVTLNWQACLLVGFAMKTVVAWTEALLMFLVLLVSMRRSVLIVETVAVVAVVEVVEVAVVALLVVATLGKAGDPLADLQRFVVVVFLVDSVSAVA
jgi:hypothetical protein